MARDFTKNRSDSYQYVLLETPHSPEMLMEYDESQGISGIFNDGLYNEKKYELQEQLLKAYWRIIDTQLTKRQRQVLRMYAEGATQTEIAKTLNVNQSSITKSIHGNCDYKNGKRVYGGARKKLIKIASEDPEIQLLLKKISELDDAL